MILFLLGVLFFGGLCACAVSTCSRNAAFTPTKKLDKVGVITNMGLCFLYVFLTIFNFVSILVTDGIVTYPGELFLPMKILSVIFPATCIISIGFSAFLRNRGKSGLSFAVQFAPLVIFGLNLLLLQLIW